jgi:hypothetical protein
MNDTNFQSGVWLPARFTDHHRKAVLKHLTEGRWTLSRTDWQWALQGFGLLHNAQANTPFGWQRFAFVYENEIEAVFVERYLTDLVALNNVSRESTPLWARYARAITALWEMTDWPQRLGEESQLLLAYWLYWWRAFATGYAFEVEVFRDLAASNVAFTAHDIRTQAGRRSSYDLEVLGLHGDIKNSLYFLRVGRLPRVRHDFYISRFRQLTRQRVMVALMQPAAWQLINGDAELTTWAAIKTTLPDVAKIMYSGREIILIAYDEWKARVRQQQHF